jgi:hypothetical protein
MRLDYHGDVTYQSSDPFFWGLAECTCAMLVFCMHSFPLVFSKMPALHIQASNFVKSLKRDSSRSLSSENKGPEDISLSDYRKIEEGKVAEHIEREGQQDKPGQPVDDGGIRVTYTVTVT